MKEIPLTKGFFAIVDDEDFEVINKYKWCASVKPNGRVYAVRKTTKKEMASGMPGCVQMQRQIMDYPAGMDVDHIDCNGLNNQRSNLRTCLHGENLRNQRVRSDNKSGFKGVTRHGNRWFAKIQVDKKQHYIGLFDCPIEAAKKYDDYAKEYHGKFARLNFRA